MNGNDLHSNDPTVVDGASVAPAVGVLPAGTAIGPYRVLRLLGEGGMGRVYLAEQQTPVFRQVALKLIRQQSANPMARVWFEVERQALAQMQHPAIAQVYDAGVAPDGTLFLAMELVDGVPITRYCRDHALSRRARLELFRRVCFGVQHAHQKGVIHRDLKPDNVLVREVDGVARPKIIDFGIAIGDTTAADPTHYERAGTTAYMSPEQAAPTRRDIDTRSDVYSLGVMLFEVLTDTDAATTTGVSIHSHADLRATLIAAGQVDTTAVPDALLAAAAGLPPELRALLAKALAPERADRYSSAAALADDIERWLVRRPLVALPPTRAYLARKFVSRHRFGLAASALVAVALIVGLTLALAAEHRARVEAARAEQVSEFVKNILSGVDPDEAQGMDTALLRKLLDRASARVATELAEQPAVRMNIELTLGGSYLAIADYRRATQHADAALQALAKTDRNHLDRGHAMIRAARLISLAGDAKRALKLGNEALALVVAAPADNPKRLDVEEQTAWFESNVGHADVATKRMQAVYEQRLAAPDRDEQAITDDLRALGTFASDSGDYARAEAMQRELLARDLKLYGRSNSNTVIAVGDLAISLLRQKKFAAGEKLLREWLPMAGKLFGNDSSMYMSMYSNLGGAIRQQGRNEEARPYYEKALAYNLRRFGPADVATVSSQANLAFLLRDAGDLTGAEQHARLAMAYMDQALGKDNGYRGTFPDLLGTILAAEKRYPEAAVAYDDAWHIFTTSQGFGADHPLAQDVVTHAIALYTAWPHPAELATWRARQVKKGHDGHA